MSAIQEFLHIIGLIESDKVKQRKEGVESFREFLSVRSNFEAVKADRSINWTQTLQSLFHLVIVERNAVAAKGKNPAAQSRLEEGAELVAWMAERVHLLLSKKGIKALMNHLMQMVAVGGVVQPYALSYLRALRLLLSYPPHLEHLDEQQWTDIVTMCFGGALGDKVKIGQELEDAEALDVDENGRRAKALRATSDDEREPTATRKTANPTETEMLRCIEIAFRSKSAPFLPYSRIIFTKFHRFLRQFSTDTTAHLPALTALNLAFAELDLNDQLAMRQLGTKLWSHILALWPTKSPLLKEQVVMALRYLLPFVSSPRDGANPTIESRLKALYEVVLSEPTLRSRDTYELHVDQLRLGLEEDGGTAAKRGAVNETRPLHSTSFRIGTGFTEKQAVAWAVLELGADSLIAVHDLTDMAVSTPQATPEGRAKRKKVEQPLSELVDSLSDKTLGPNVIAFRVQLLLFLVERHWSALHLAICQRILAALIPFLSQGDHQVQTWAYLVVAAIVHFDLPSAPPIGERAVRNSKLDVPWDHVWTVVLRKISNADLSRVASHVATILLAHDRVTSVPLAAAVESFAKDLDVQGPSFPSDSVCSFLEWCIVLASNDIHLYRLHLPEKVLSWLTTAWKPLDGIQRPASWAHTRDRSDPLSVSHLISLITRICSIERAPRLPFDFVVPDCPVATMIVDQCETAALRDYIDGRVPPYSCDTTSSTSIRTPETASLSVASGATVDDPDYKTERRISAWLQRLLENLARDAEDGSVNGLDYWVVLNGDLMRRHLDLASVALVVQGLFSLNKRHESKATIRAAADIFSKLAPTIGMSKWSPLERAVLIGGLSPVFVPLPDYPAVPYPVLLDPGPASDLPLHLVPKRQQQTVLVDFTSPELRLLQTIWKDRHTQGALEEITSVLSNVLVGVAVSVDLLDGEDRAPRSTQASQRLRKVEKSQMDDDFGEVKVATKAAQILGPSGNLRAGMATMALTLRGLISGEMARSGALGSVRLQEVVDAIVEADGSEAIVIAEQLFSAVRCGIASLSLGHADAILQHLGGELLPDYRFARDERFALLGLRFLECTASMWIHTDDSEAAAEFGNNARTLCAWYTNALHRQVLAAWRVRLRFTSFLDVYLSIDSTQEMWSRGDQPVRQGDIQAILPTAILPSMLSDRDFRVRFRASSSAPDLFTFLHDNGLDAAPLFRDIKKHLETNLLEFEKVLTQIVCHANIMIVSASRRRAPYRFLLAKVCGEAPEYTRQTVAVFKGVAERLGLGGLKDLYHLYARYITQLLYKEGELGLGSLPYQLCGWSSIREARAAEFRQVASFWLSTDEGQDAYHKLCDVVKLSHQAGARDCFPEAAALILASKFSLIIDGAEDVKAVETALDNLAGQAGCGDAYQVGSLLDSLANEIATELLSLLHERRWPAGLPSTLAHEPKVAETFASILALPTELVLVEANPPYYESSVIIAAISWLEKQHPVFNHTPSLFAVVHDLLHRVHVAPFTDLQRDKLISLALALALSGRLARDPTILSALAESLIVLLPQAGLASLVINILKWSLGQWLNLDVTVLQLSGADLCANVVKAAHACKRLLDAPGTPEVLTLAQGLATFLNSAANQLEDLKEPTIVEAYLLWPWPIVDTGNLHLDSLQDVLSTSFSPVGKFSLVQALTGRDDFAGSPKQGLILWRLMESLSSSIPKPSPGDSIALADLLYSAAGTVEAPQLDELKPTDLETASENFTEDRGIKLAIVVKVLECLHRPDQKLVHQAFDVARLLFSVPSAATLFPVMDLPHSCVNLATFLSNSSLLRPSRLRQRAPRQLQELQEDHRWLDAAQDYSRWIRDLAELLADCRAESEPFYAQLVPLITISAPFAGAILAHLVHSILFQAANASDSASRKPLSDYLAALLRDKSSSSECVRAIVDMAAYLRRHPRPDLANPLSSSDMWLEVPWIDLAEGAVKTGAYLTGLLFIELAHEYDGLFKAKKDGAQATSRQLDNRGQDLLYSIYANIDEPDGFYGRQSVDVRKALVKRYHHENRWSEAFGVHGADFESQSRRLASQDTGPTSGVIQSLASFGFNRLAMNILGPARAEGGLEEQDLPTGLPYDLAWRTDTWDLPIDRSAVSTSSVALYSALRSVHSGQEVELLKRNLGLAMASEVSKLSTVSLDHPRPNINVVSTVLALREVHRLAQLNLGDRFDPALTNDIALVPAGLDFHQSDRILSTRISILRGIRLAEQAEAVGDDFATALYRDASELERACLVRLSAVARESGQLQASMNAVTLANKLVESGIRADDVDEELAQVLWAQGEHSTAIAMLESLSGRGLPKKALVWARLGEWTTEARLRSSREILERSFQPAADALDNTYTSTERSQVFATFAAFADNQFQELSKSTAEKRRRFETYKKRKQHEFSEIERVLEGGGSSGSGPSSNQLERSKTVGEAHLKEDERQLETAEATTRDMRWRALENYGKALVESDDHDDKILRFTALWLAHADDDDLNRKLRKSVKAIPSHKFVFLAYQLSARLSDPVEPTPFSKAVRELVERLCTDHPYHSVFPVNALRDITSSVSSSSKSSRSSRRSSTAPTEANVSNKSRAQAANDVIAKVRAKPALSARISAIELACDAYREWAEVDLKASANNYTNGPKGAVKKGLLVILKSAKIVSELRNLPIPVTSYDLAVDPTCRYEPGSFPSIVKYKETFQNAGGMNMPKIVWCIGSDGVEYKQLLKGNDDIRQDAVMEQLFTLVNTMLDRDEKTRRRKLLIRTYKVVPLQHATGLIEFVRNTQALGDKVIPLYDNLPSTCLRPREARLKMQNVDRGADAAQYAANKDATFRNVLAKMPPMMRHLFFREHKTPSLWFDMRLNYSRSVATTSIIGHVIGLGDRHVSNILMDEVRGELVAIDLGIAFDQGKRLPIPETVPFRLTQNLVDGFGHSGVEGVFRRCSEETLRVLRRQSNVLLTVLEVFKHDPLQTWAVSADIVKRVQGSEERDAVAIEDLPDDADRALSIVSGKLDTKLSVEYTVNQLIQEAMDPANLSQLFHGWQSYL